MNYFDYFFTCDSVANQLWLVCDTVATSRKPTRKIFWLVCKRLRPLANQPKVGLRHCLDTVATNHKMTNHEVANHKPYVRHQTPMLCIG